MVLEDTDAAQVVAQMDAFFEAAFVEKSTINVLRLGELFKDHIRVTRDQAAGLLQLARTDPGVLSELAERLKSAADRAHPGITKMMPATDVLGYTLNTLADGHGIPQEERFGVTLPPHLITHGDSLFVSEAKKENL